MEDQFNIFAVRVNNGCAKYIRRCLKENIYYYLNHDYVIDGNTISRRSPYVDPICSDFFHTDSMRDGIRFNVAAIAGMNGDGKSSIVELIMRVLNNYAAQEHPNLKIVSGLNADLVVRSGEKFYCLRATDSHVRSFVYEPTQDGRWILDDEEPEECPNVYTMVSNYSLYAYNEYDFAKEWNNEEVYDMEGEACWLHHVFHKNDGYQAPLSLHPFRSKGIIDVNRERLLSEQRLLSVLIRSVGSDANGFRVMNDKVATHIILTRNKESKFIKYVLEGTLKSLREEQLLKSRIEEVQRRGNGSEARKEILKQMQITFETHFKGDESVYRAIYVWAKTHGILSMASDTLRYIELIETDARIFLEIDKLDGYLFFKEIEEFSWAQIQYIYYILQVDKMWREKGINVAGKHILIPSILENIFKSNISEIDSCRAYLLYKTIAIFEKYPLYGNPEKYWIMAPCLLPPVTIGWGNELGNFKSEIFPIESAFKILEDDWEEKSHITLKLRQVYKFMKGLEQNPAYLYLDPQVCEPCHDKTQTENSWDVGLDKLMEFYPDEMQDIENMPPRIYEWEVIYKSTRDGSLIQLSTFSSGEKQWLYSLSAVIYHLLNLDSISNQEANRIYGTVNLIFEEVELYFHPEWQRQLVSQLLKRISAYSYKHLRAVNMLFVTHSPFILSDIPKTNVLFLQNGEPIEKMQENTFGANINGLLKNGFFLPGLPIGEFAHEKIDNLFALLHSGEFDRSKKETLRQDIMRIGEPFLRKQLLSLLNEY